MIIIRWAISLVMGATVTLCLFYFMQYLISTGEQLDQQISVVKLVDATMPDIDLEVIEEIDEPEPIEEVQEEQPDIPDKQIDLDPGPSINIQQSAIVLDSGIAIDSQSIGATDGNYLPLVTIAPTYPQRAASRGIEGWCLVSFTVDGNGNVMEDTIVVVDADPANIFDRSSERAAARFKFQPRVKDGQGMIVEDVQYLFTYQLEGEQ